MRRSHLIRRPPSRTWLATLLLLALAAVPARAADRFDVIGGDGIVPINPNFNPDTSLIVTLPNGDQIDLASTQITGQGFLGRINFQQTAFALGQNLSQDLSAALTQSLSASNRPSVVTPYSGILVFDPATGQPIYDSFGSLVTNKANTIGKGKIGLGLSYQHATFDSFDGEDIGRQVDTTIVSEQDIEIPSTFIFESITGDVLTRSTEPFRSVIDIRARNVEFDADVVTLTLIYGLLENVDIGALIPYIWLTTRGEVEIKVDQSVVLESEVNLEGSDTPLIVPLGAASSTRKFKGEFDRDFDGIGDIILFTKWQILSQFGLPKRTKAPLDLALQFEVKLPTGDEDEFLGTGHTDLALRMLMQRELTKRFILRGELGGSISTLGSEYSSFDYKLGIEGLITNDLAGGVELIGSYTRAFESVLDAAASLKYSVTRDFKVFAGVRVPLNDNGLRYDYSPIVGFEYVFQRAADSGMEDIEMMEPGEGEAEDPFAAPAEDDPFAPAAADDPFAPADEGAAAPSAEPATTPVAPTEPISSAPPAAPSQSQSLHIVDTESVHIDATGDAPVDAAPETGYPDSDNADQTLPLPKGPNR
ncbi:MAG: hypothetical protein BWZ08_01465 [candidate division BRC1 bacterium ADurb.BinA292]|nr:MAG: hypothetical protein BWZ08_01465 [candidate division BRC1 bacterium ADurb.BinA292]